MDFNIVALELSDLAAHFDYFDTLVTHLGEPEEQIKLRKKHQEHLAVLSTGNKLYPLSETKQTIIVKLQALKPKDIHDLVEKLEKDAKKMKKLYKSLKPQ